MGFAAPIAIAGLALSAVGTAAGVAGQISSSEAQSANAKYQAQVAANNQTIANQNAEHAAQAGSVQTTSAQLRQRQTMGAVASELASSGLDVNTGTPSDVRKSAAEVTQLDTETTANNAALQVYGYRTQGSNFGAQSGLETAEASQAQEAGLIGGGSSLLSGAGSLASKWANWQTNHGNSTGGGYVDDGPFDV